MRTIYVSTDPTGCGHKHWFILYIYATAEQLQAAARRYGSSADTRSAAYWEGCYGCFQPRYTEGVKRVNNVVVPVRVPKTSFIGVMRLCEEHLTEGVIVHESVHAAINLVRAMTLNIEFDLHNSVENEEALAYAAQHISSAVLQAVNALPADQKARRFRYVES